MTDQPAPTEQTTREGRCPRCGSDDPALTRGEPWTPFDCSDPAYFHDPTPEQTPEPCQCSTPCAAERGERHGGACQRGHGHYPASLHPQQTTEERGEAREWTIEVCPRCDGSEFVSESEDDEGERRALCADCGHLVQPQPWRVRAAAPEERGDERLREALDSIYRLVRLRSGELHVGVGEACGVDACLVCLIEETARAALAEERSGGVSTCPQCGGTPDAPASDPINGPRVPCCDPIHREGR